MAPTPMCCGHCGKAIRKGQKVAALVQWNEVLVHKTTGEEHDNDNELFAQDYEVEMSLSPDLLPQATIKLIGAMDGENEKGDWTLKKPPTVTVLHLHNCGVTDRPLRRVSGSFEAGKRR